MGCSDVSVLMKVAMFLGIIAFLFDLIGFASPYWFTKVCGDITQNALLWQICNSTCNTIPSEDLTSSMKTSRVFNILGFLAGAVAMMLIIFYAYCGADNRRVRLAGMVNAFAAALLIIVGVIIIGTSDALQEASVGWAMILAIIGAILYFITGVLLGIVSDTPIYSL